MATDTSSELRKHFAAPGQELDPPLENELQSILRLHDLTPQELFYKWESYSIKLGGTERLAPNLQRIRELKQNINDALERETRGKTHVRNDRRAVGATPRAGSKAAGGDMFGMMEGVVQTPARPAVNGSSSKRKQHFATPSGKASKPHAESSPSDAKANGNAFAASNVPFSERKNPGDTVETLNDHIDVPSPPTAPFSSSRVALKANTDLKKFAYKTMAMKLSNASEILDDRIDEMLALVQEHHKLEDGAFGNPSLQSTSEIVAVGRIACDTSDGNLKPGSIVLEASRRTGAGLRTPLQLDRVEGYEVFPGKIVAVRGINASGDAFTVSEFLEIPRLQLPAVPVPQLNEIHKRLLAGGDESNASQPLNVIASSGPYTADSDLAYEPLHALVDRAIETSADALILLGPFLDIEHPLIRSGEIPPLPQSLNIDPDTATLTDVFRGLISVQLQRLAKAIPGISIVMVPSVRDAVNKHAAWPQDMLPRPKELGLPKQCVRATNPITISLNELVFGISTQDILYDLRWEQCVGGKPPTQDPLARLSKHLIEQRHFYPLHPARARTALGKPAPAMTDDEEGPLATGAALDVGYLALGDWHTCKPDVLITPSALNPFARVVEGVMVLNPGMVWSRGKGAGTFCQMYVGERKLKEEEREKAGEELVNNELWDRARVDVVRI